MRLDKLVADRTPHSRKEVKALLRAGAVQVDGVTATDGGMQVDPNVQKITCQGKNIVSGSHVYCIVNKPKGFICATEDRQHRTVLELLPEALRVKGMFPAGRLDADSTGLVLLTDDGELAHQMLSPKHHVDKYYIAQLARPFEAAYVQAFADGMTLADGTVCRPAQIRELPDGFALVCLHEGKYHQVRRMLAALGNHVEHLHRVAIGGLLLPPDLPSGKHLELLNKDVEKLLKTEAFPGMCERIVTRFSSYSINARR